MTRSALKKHGFGILTEIDLQEKFREKLNREFRPYRILGACSPSHAYEALQCEDKIGTMLPCNVIVQEHGPDRVEISAVDPVASMRAVENSELSSVATEVQAMLRETIEELAD